MAQIECWASSMPSTCAAVSSTPALAIPSPPGVRACQAFVLPRHSGSPAPAFPEAAEAGADPAGAGAAAGGEGQRVHPAAGAAGEEAGGGPAEQQRVSGALLQGGVLGEGLLPGHPRALGWQVTQFPLQPGGPGLEPTTPLQGPALQAVLLGGRGSGPQGS